MHPPLDLAALRQLDLEATVELAKRRDARTQENGVNVQSDLVHEIGGQQRLCQFAAAHETNVLPGPLLQIARQTRTTLSGVSRT